MTTTNDPFAPQPDDLQLDRAEFVAGAASADICELCKSTIGGRYYAAAGSLFCEACHHRIEAEFRGGTPIGRFVKAFILGSIAATVGSLVYYGITKTTGWNIGLVAIVVGVMIGGAVKTGSGNLGGRAYQYLAVFLTYSAIAGMIIPYFLAGFGPLLEKRRAGELMHVVETAKTDAPATPRDEKGAKADIPRNDVLAKTNPSQPDPKKPLPGAERNDQPAAPAVVETKVDANGPPTPQAKAPAADPIAGDQKKVEGEAKAKEPPARKPAEPRTSLVRLIFQLIVAVSALLGLVYAFPVFVAFHTPISGLIYGFAIWEAWKINRKVELDFEGPFTIEARANGGGRVA